MCVSWCVNMGVNSVEDLPVKPQKDWVHMDKLELEKLEWMRDLPSPRKRGTKKVRRDFSSRMCCLEFKWFDLVISTSFGLS